MKTYLHTIALEPARWTPERVSRPLIEILGPIKAGGFDELEIFEPHLTFAEDEEELRQALREHGLEARILSSYLDVSPSKNTPHQFQEAAQDVVERMERWGFQAIRLFPGRLVSTENSEEWQTLLARYRLVADALPHAEILLETHDGSIADDPALLAAAVKQAERPNIKLVYQPTVFEAERAQIQFTLQLPWIRHLHLQNRNKDLSMVRLKSGVIPWEVLLAAAPKGVSASIEFVASGIKPVAEFSLEAALQEAIETRNWVKQVTQTASGTL
jgi:sugar phosphate isomerase/epimerase